MGMTKKPPTGGSFKPGQSGNPGGRAKKTPEEFALIDACKTKTPDALLVIEGIMRNGESDKVRLSAAQYIIDRAYGKAKQETDINVAGELGIRNLTIEFVSPKK